MNEDFWNGLEDLVGGDEIRIDRPKGTAHPRFPDYIYPYDYGYISNTTSADGAEIDVWQIDNSKIVTGIIVVVDSVKKDSEIKVLLGVTSAQANEILACHRRGKVEALLISRS